MKNTPIEKENFKSYQSPMRAFNAFSSFLIIHQWLQSVSMLVRGRVGRLQPACKPCKSLSYRVIFIELKTALSFPVLIYLQLVQGTQGQTNAHPLPVCTCDVNEILIAWKKQTTKVFFRSTTGQVRD